MKDIFFYVGVVIYCIGFTVFFENIPESLSIYVIIIGVAGLLFAAYKGWIKDDSSSDEQTRKYY